MPVAKPTHVASLRVSRLFPFLRWFVGYRWSHLRADLIAGFTVALVLIPQSMAYAQLAGLPAYYGLYAAFLPPMVASLFGSSNQLATGPVAVVSLITAASLGSLATAGSAQFIAYAVLLSILVGGFQLLLGVLRLGLVVNFLSHPVVQGFTNAAALIIATSQLSKLFGVSVDEAEHHYETVYRVVVAATHHTHWPTFGLAVLAVSIMLVLRRINRKIPDVLVAVVVTTALAWAIGFERNRTVSIGEIDDATAVQAIRDFNQTLADLEAAGAGKVAAVERLRRAQEGGESKTQLMDLQHEVARQDQDVEEVRSRLSEHRNKLRAMALIAVTDADGAAHYVLRQNVPPVTRHDDRIWRIKTGMARLDEQSVTLLGGGAVVGTVPKGLRFQLPTQDNKGRPLDLWAVVPQLLSVSAVISLLGFMEAISIAKAMAAKTGQRLDPNQELVGQGLANIVGAFVQSYPVSGSFSRSAVNLQSGGLTGLSMVCSSGVVLLTLMFFTPLLYHLPQSVLASIIMMAVIGLLNVKAFAHAWRAQKYDGAISVITFLCTLGYAPHLDRGIMLGVVLSVGLYLLRNMKPDIALLSKHWDRTFRNASRFDLSLCKHIAVIRFSGSLFFVNVNYLEEKVLERIASMPELRHILIVGNGINELDASGEDMLSMLVGRLREAGYEVSLSGLNDSVLDVLRRTRLYERIGEDHLFRNVGMAIDAIHADAHRGSNEKPCPLLEAPPAPQRATSSVAPEPADGRGATAGGA